MATRLGALGTRETLTGSNGATLLWLYRVPAGSLPGLQNPLNALALGGSFVQPQTTGRAVWDKQIELLGQRIDPTGPGGRNLTVTLFLRALQPLTQNYTFSVKARDEQERVWGQEDKFPGDNSYPTSLWDPGDVVIEKFYPGLDPCAPAGEYHLTVEAYNPKTNQVLEVGTGANLVTLGTSDLGASEGNRLQDLNPDRELDLDIASQLHLLGITWLQSEVRAGEPLALELFWKGTAGGAQMPVFLHLRDSAGNDLKSAEKTISLPGAGRGVCTLFDLQMPVTLGPGAVGIFVNDTKIDSINISK